MHKKGVLHGDLKLDNIYLSQNMGVRVGDFGSATTLYNPRQTTLGTEHSIDPEASTKQNCTFEADI